MILLETIVGIKRSGSAILMNSILVRITFISFLFVLLSIPSFTFAELKILVREYTYQEREDDSSYSSRTILLSKVKRLLLEELGTYLESVTGVQNLPLTKDQIVTLSAGIVHTEIVDEKWDGRIYRLRARIVVDSDNIIKSIYALRSDRTKTKELEEVRERSDKQLREIEELRKEFASAEYESLTKTKAAYDDTIRSLKAIEWFEKGFASGMSGDHNAAIENFSMAINLDPKFAIAYSNRGSAYINLGKRMQAIEDYNKAMELNPKYAETYHNRLLAYGKLNDRDQASVDRAVAAATQRIETEEGGIKKGTALGGVKVYIHYARDKDKKKAEDFSVFLKSKGYASVEVEKIHHNTRDIRYFHDDDQDSALLLKKHLNTFLAGSTIARKINMHIKNLSTRYPRVKKGTLEMWVFF
jgi:tetratricopeptide (TPR) repeat protein